MDYAIAADGPVAIKYPKGEAYSGLDEKNLQYINGKAEVINFSSQVGEIQNKTLAIIAVGSMVRTGVAVRDKLKAELGYEPELISLRFINPLDTDRIRETFEQFDYVALLEESVKRGSVGEAVAYEIREKSVQMLHYCIGTETVQHGSVARLKAELGLDVDSIYEDILMHIKL